MVLTDIFCICALFISALLSGISGFGFSMVALTLLSFVFDIKQAVPFLVIHALTCNIFQLVKLKKYINIKHHLILLSGALVGVPIGVYLLKTAGTFWIKKLLGVIVISYVVNESLTKTKDSDENKTEESEETVETGEKSSSLVFKKQKAIGFIVGKISGILMGSILSGGSPIIIYSMKISKNKYVIKATLQSFFLLCSIYSLILYFISGLLSTNILMSSMLYLPATIIGTIVGMRIFECISAKTFNKAVLFFLTLLGLLMLFK
jgi:hypothetical protein